MWGVRYFLLMIAVLALVGGCCSTPKIIPNKADAKEDADWRVYLGGKERNLYSSLKQINRDNVTKLEVAWTFETGDKLSTRRTT